MKNIVCESKLCTGCNACVNKCPKNAISIEDDGFVLNARIDENKCVECGLCLKICPNLNDAQFNSPINILQGWSNSKVIRESSSSGGFASTAILKCLEMDVAVFTCCFKDSELIYDKVQRYEDLSRFVGSKYLKSNTKKIFKSIEDELKKGNKVLFIGLPCHVAGLYSSLNSEHKDNLLTIDLICHGSPSQKLFKKMINENNLVQNDFSDFSFRKHADFSTTFDKRQGFFYWTIPFLKGQTYTENCYSCKYARFERVADITIGDAWGSNLGQTELMKGLSLILVNTKKGEEFLNLLDFHYEAMDKNVAIASNGQLDHPSKKPSNRDAFIALFKTKQNYFYSIKKTNKKIIFIARIKNSLFWKIGRRIIRGHW